MRQGTCPAEEACGMAAVFGFRRYQGQSDRPRQGGHRRLCLAAPGTDGSVCRRRHDLHAAAPSDGQVLVLFQLRRLPEQGGHHLKEQAGHKKSGDEQGVIGEDGKSKTVMKGLLLSKDRECYKGIDQPKGQNQDYQFDNKDNSNNTNIEQSNLPVKQSRFSKFFSQVRSKLARQKNGYEQGKKTYGKQDTEQYQQTFEGNKKTNQSQEKKSWKLEPEEKARIQKETVEIAKRHREQETQKQQESSQNIQQAQNNMQQSQQGQVYPQTPPAQPMMDMGGMEL